MQSSRTYSNTFVKKPRVILDKRFPFVKTLKVGDKGQFNAMLDIEGIRTQMDSEGNEMRLTTMKITKAEPLEQQDTRL